ncbi:MAG: apolipoprotein N-acyltransferase [Pseudomonadota bacterium]
MKTPEPTERYLYSILSGLMLTASFPPGKTDWMAWVALVPLFIGLYRASPFHAFKVGLVAGFAHYLTLLYWIIVALEHYGNIHYTVSVGILFMLCLYLALYTALFSTFAAKIRGSWFSLFRLAGFWVALEYLRANLLTGFPWCLLGYTQYRHLELIQLADLVGVYGLSFVLVLSSALIYALLVDRRFLKEGTLKWEIPAVLIVGCLAYAYGHFRLSEVPPREEGERPWRIAIVQGSIDQSVKWNPAFQKKTIQIYHRLSRTTFGFRPDLIVWPETSVPFFFQDAASLAQRVMLVSRESGADMIFGSPAYRRGEGPVRLYNRAFHLSSTGDLGGYYDKVHLVPFGEYVPLKKFLPFVDRLVVSVGDFAPGEKLSPLKLQHFNAGVLICYEIIFPELARTQAKNGAQILVNLTNDAWYGMTSAPYQHFSMAVFRAVENGRPLVRAANTGISAFIGPRGRIMDQSELFQETALTREFKPSDPALTIYTRYGDLFAQTLSVISLINFFFLLCYPSKKRPRVPKGTLIGPS